MEESKKCTQCKRTLLLEQFRMNKRTGQVTKQCIKCLDIAKKSIEKHKCSHGKKKPWCKENVHVEVKYVNIKKEGVIVKNVEVGLYVNIKE